jgi:hypothetical protein
MTRFNTMTFKRLTIIFFLYLSQSYAQVGTKKNLGSWYIYDGTHIISNKLSFKTGVQFRFFEITSNFNLLLVSTGINYHVSPKTTITLNYSYLDVDRSIEATGETHLFENRLYEQINFKHKIKHFTITNRIRLENRFLNDLDKNTTLNRIRYQLGASVNLNKSLFVLFNDEVFANLQSKMFTENRFYTGLGIHVSKFNNIELGYLKQRINGVTINRFQAAIYIKTKHQKTKV